jgi:uncharacterized membrane protein SpoIIM required for sporulation
VKQDSFERAREQRWQRFEAMLDALDEGGTPAGDFPTEYRRVCVDLALARTRGFASSLVERLNQLTLRGHQRLYGQRIGRLRPVEFLARSFPAAVRAQARVLAAAALLFYGTAVLVFALDLRDPELIYHVLSPDQVRSFEEMYDPAAEHYGTPRGTIGDLGAFSFYVSNNIGVALRTFAWGMFAGVGSLFLLAFNGLMLGVIAAHVTLEGYATPFFTFVIGHSALELTAVLIGGVAGLKLGWALVAPGNATRRLALRSAADAVVPLLYGTIAMLLMAAVVEAFWSANRAISDELKLAVGACGWGLVLAWIGLGGRRRAH